MRIEELAAHTFAALKNEEYFIVIQVWKTQSPFIQEHPILEPRFHAWCAQAHIQLNEPEQALRHCNSGIRLAKNIQDEMGVKALKSLREKANHLYAAKMQRKPEPGNSLLEQAIQAMDDECFDKGKVLGLKALEEAITSNDDKEEILALLTLARNPAEQAQWLQQAYQRSQVINDFNLITLVKKSMDSLGVSVPVVIF